MMTSSVWWSRKLQQLPTVTELVHCLLNSVSRWEVLPVSISAKLGILVTNGTLTTLNC